MMVKIMYADGVSKPYLTHLLENDGGMVQGAVLGVPGEAPKSLDFVEILLFDYTYTIYNVGSPT